MKCKILYNFNSLQHIVLCLFLLLSSSCTFWSPTSLYFFTFWSSLLLMFWAVPLEREWMGEKKKEKREGREKKKVNPTLSVLLLSGANDAVKSKRLEFLLLLIGAAPLLMMLILAGWQGRVPGWKSCCQWRRGAPGCVAGAKPGVAVWKHGDPRSHVEN